MALIWPTDFNRRRTDAWNGIALPPDVVHGSPNVTPSLDRSWLVNIKQIFSRAIILVIFRMPFERIMALLVAHPSLSNSAAISILVDAPITESTTIVTKRFLLDLRTDSTIVSIASKISSIVSKGT